MNFKNLFILDSLSNQKNLNKPIEMSWLRVTHHQNTSQMFFIYVRNLAINHFIKFYGVTNPAILSPVLICFLLTQETIFNS